MHLGVNVPNYGPGTDPGVLREWARLVEGLGFDLLMVSDHVVVTLDDLAELRRLGADTVVLDPYHGDPEETRRPGTAWRALTAVATHWRTAP
jgi:hypothetical protein